MSGFTLVDNANLHGQTHTVSNVTDVSFTIEQANVTSNITLANASFGWHGRTEITTNGEHGVGTGGMVKIIANEFLSGYYYVRTASSNTIVINKSYVFWIQHR